MHSLLPALLALGAAALMALGTVVRHRASAASTRLTLQWWLGALAGVGGFLFQAAALALGPVLFVQPLIVLSVLFTLPMEKWFNGILPSSRQWLWGVLLALGVGAFVAFVRLVPAIMGRRRWVLVLVVAILLAVIAGLVVFAEWSVRAPRALIYGTVAGSLFGIAAVLINVIGQDWRHPLETVREAPVYLTIAVCVAAVYCQQRAFAAGHLQASFPALMVAEPVVSIALGMAVLGEKLDRHSWATAVSLLGLALMLVAVVRLSRLSVAAQESAEDHREVAAPVGERP